MKKSYLENFKNLKIYFRCGDINLHTASDGTKYLEMDERQTKTWTGENINDVIVEKDEIDTRNTHIHDRSLYQVRVITVFTVFRLLTDFVCLYTHEFWISLCKIVRSSVILLWPSFTGLVQTLNKKNPKGLKRPPLSKMIRWCKYFTYVSKRNYKHDFF